MNDSGGKEWFDIVVQYGNQEQKLGVKPNFVVMRVLEEAVKAFGQSPPFENWQLFYEGEPLTELNKSLESYGVGEDAVLVLVHEHVTG